MSNETFVVRAISQPRVTASCLVLYISHMPHFQYVCFSDHTNFIQFLPVRKRLELWLKNSDKTLTESILKQGSFVCVCLQCVCFVCVCVMEQMLRTILHDSMSLVLPSSRGTSLKRPIHSHHTCMKYIILKYYIDSQAILRYLGKFLEYQYVSSSAGNQFPFWSNSNHPRLHGSIL